jgi:hypothetical protein
LTRPFAVAALCLSSFAVAALCLSSFAVAALCLSSFAACSPGATWSPPPGIAGPIPPVVATGRVDPAFDAFFDEAPVDGTHPVLERLGRESRAVSETVTSPWVKRWLEGVKVLPEVRRASMYRSADKSRWFSERQRAALTPAERAELVAEPLDTERYYYTKYGSPLAYARPLELAALAGMPAPKRVVDFGYGTVGHLRLFAVMDVESVGIDVDPFLRALYANPADQGPFPPSGAGSVKLIHGSFPKVEVGDQLSLFLSKNVLKRGYIHPAEPVSAEQTIDLGVSDADFVAAVHQRLSPGGYFMIYNITPAPNGPGLPYRTWADGRCPFSRGLLEASRFDVVAYDIDDSEAARRQGRALGWDADIDLEASIFASYSLARKR